MKKLVGMVLSAMFCCSMFSVIACGSDAAPGDDSVEGLTGQESKVEPQSTTACGWPLGTSCTGNYGSGIGAHPCCAAVPVCHRQSYPIISYCAPS
jgi:hypothetical protein